MSFRSYLQDHPKPLVRDVDAVNPYLVPFHFHDRARGALGEFVVGGPYRIDRAGRVSLQNRFHLDPGGKRRGVGHIAETRPLFYARVSVHDFHVSLHAFFHGCVAGDPDNRDAGLAPRVTDHAGKLSDTASTPSVPLWSKE